MAEIVRGDAELADVEDRITAVFLVALDCLVHEPWMARLGQVRGQQREQQVVRIQAVGRGHRGLFAVRA